MDYEIKKPIQDFPDNMRTRTKKMKGIKEKNSNYELLENHLFD